MQYSQIAMLKTVPPNTPTPPLCWNRQVSRTTVTLPDGSTKLVTVRQDQQVPVVYDWVGKPMMAGS